MLASIQGKENENSKIKVIKNKSDIDKMEVKWDSKSKDYYMRKDKNKKVIDILLAL
jgi:hypothetical protein